jgi:hypothetical protein
MIWLKILHCGEEFLTVEHKVVYSKSMLENV